MTTVEPYENQHDDEPVAAAGYRTYEVYQRERVGETTNRLKPRQLISDEYLEDPYPVLETLREHYPCYRDWVGNRFWVTRYDDVSSVFADEANYETRTKRWYYATSGLGRDLWGELPVLWARSNIVDAALAPILDRMLDDLGRRPDVAQGFAAQLPLELWGAVLDIPPDDLAGFASRYWRMQRGWRWDPVAARDGLSAAAELVEYFEPIVEQRRAAPGDDLISASVRLELEDGPATAADIVATILEADHETLHGGLANMWFQLLTNPGEFELVRGERRLMKFAWLETLRHSPPVLSAERFARHEVERFGRLIPAGGLVYCSAAAANRDPRVFSEPDSFLVGRKDLCQREPRGQYRADGLPSGIAFGLGRPSAHPAVPKERPRSLYALTRDVAVEASARLLETYPGIRLESGATPSVHSLRLGEMQACWQLPVTL